MIILWDSFCYSICHFDVGIILKWCSAVSSLNFMILYGKDDFELIHCLHALFFLLLLLKFGSLYQAKNVQIVMHSLDCLFTHFVVILFLFWCFLGLDCDQKFNRCLLLWRWLLRSLMDPIPNKPILSVFLMIEHYKIRLCE